MPVRSNHAIIPTKNRDESARYLRDLFELPEAPSWGPFTNIQLDEGVLLQFAELPGIDQVQMHHYAFLVDDVRPGLRPLQAGSIEHWTDPQMTRPGETNTEHGDRGVYFKDPAGHATN